MFIRLNIFDEVACYEKDGKAIAWIEDPLGFVHPDGPFFTECEEENDDNYSIDHSNSYTYMDDDWGNNVGECEYYFWGVCQGKEKGIPCKQPSDYGCQYKGELEYKGEE